MTIYWQSWKKHEDRPLYYFFFSTKLIKYYRLYIILITKYSCIVCYISGNICLYIIAISVVIFIFVIHGKVTENNFCYSTGMSFLLVSSF